MMKPVKIFATHILLILCFSLFAGCFLNQDDNDNNDASMGRFNGLVVEGGDTIFTGAPIPFVEIECEPTIANLTMTDGNGHFSTDLVDIDTEYRFTASKSGYITKSRKARTTGDDVEIKFTLERDNTNYDFITLTITDTRGFVLEKVLVSSAGQAKIDSFYTNESGQVSYPFPAMRESSMTVSKDGFGPLVGTYSTVTGNFNKMSGYGVVRSSGENLFVTMVSQLEIEQDETPPSVLSTNPSAGDTMQPTNTSIQLTLDEHVEPETVTPGRLSVQANGTLINGNIEVLNNAIIFTPLNGLPENTICLVTLFPGVEDLVGNATVNSHEFSFETGIVQDTEPPEVSSVYPYDNSSEVSTESSISITFNEPVDPNSISAQTIRMQDGDTTITGSLSVDSDTVTFTPSTMLQNNTMYAVTASTGIRDLSGNHLANNYTWYFTTETDTSPPEVTSTSPAGNATAVSTTSNISVTFNENIDPTTVNSQTFIVDNGGSTVDGNIACNGKTAQFDPIDELQANSTYTVILSTDIRDTNGNRMNSTYSWSFTTDDAPPVTVELDVSADTMVSQFYPDQNYANQSVIPIECNASGTLRGLVQFDLSGIPDGATVHSATLKLYLYWSQFNSSEKSEYVTVRGVLGNWNENDVTWNTMPAMGSIMDTVLVQQGEMDIWHTFSPGVATVQSWVDDSSQNYGIYLGFHDETTPDSSFNTVNYCSSEHQDISCRPVLLVEYSL
ncbi:MAG: Ig-like domain-containing protein [Spirochaetota bacterium]